MNIKTLNEDFIRRATASTMPVTAPISPKENPANIAVMANRWQQQRTQDGGHLLLKAYKFRTTKLRNSFVKGLLSYEEQVQHCAVITIQDDTVSLVVWTKGIDSVSSLDIEYAKFADTHYRDVTYNMSNEVNSSHHRLIDRRSHERFIEEFESDEFS